MASAPARLIYLFIFPVGVFSVRDVTSLTRETPQLPVECHHFTQPIPIPTVVDLCRNGRRRIKKHVKSGETLPRGRIFFPKTCLGADFFFDEPAWGQVFPLLSPTLFL
jgi:hypothetical protein